MDSDFNTCASEAHPESMDFLSRAWCNFAVQAFQPELQDRALVLQDNSSSLSLDKYENDSLNMEKIANMDDTYKSVPHWKSNDVKSWIWMQQAMHPELNYNSYFQKKWVSWKMLSFKNISIKKWLKEIKKKRKEDRRLQRAEVHAAISVAGVAAALAAIAAEGSKNNKSGPEKESTMASAAALVAAQCAQVAEAMGAKREQLSNAIGSAMRSTSASDILTLTAAATTSLRGAATLKARFGCKIRLNGIAPLLPIEENNEFDFDFDECRSVLAKGANLSVEMSDGRCKLRSVSIILNSEDKAVLRLKKLNLLNSLASKKESIILDLQAELYKDSKAEEMETCYLIVLTTNHGIMKLDMMDDYHCYKMWAMTINHMLMLSTSFTTYDLQPYNG